ncbi:N-formylglutamate amidohydrolase [Amorphus orientalis]|uniref:N-formylglutamate amidohydrolase n=1 Tax=Amorphus orientalis TaxID=649198 RepID=A0AAE4AVU6_9HYPH|nr:N-formylglutamate amidohydrolase [Amorphus orientalis]
MSSSPFEIVEPAAQCSPFVFNSPHSGTAYPRSFLNSSRLDSSSIRRSEDTFVDELFAGVVELGAPLMRAHFPRAFLDVNREPYELDPAMFSGRLPAYVNARSIRVAGGLGTIARVVADSEEIYRDRLPVAEGLDRIERIYKPYHAALRDRLAETMANFGVAVLVDCHSMPSTARGLENRPRPDLIIGDRFGTSCAPGLADTAIALLSDLGYHVGRNRPYAGGYITEHYGRPQSGLHALQIEVNRGLYMDEQRFRKTAGFDALAQDLALFAERLMALALYSGAVADAAE